MYFSRRLYLPAWMFIFLFAIQPPKSSIAPVLTLTSVIPATPIIRFIISFMKQIEYFCARGPGLFDRSRGDLLDIVTLLYGGNSRPDELMEASSVGGAADGVHRCRVESQML